MTATTETTSVPRNPRLDWIRHNPTIVIGSTILLGLVTLAVIAPWIADDPLSFDPLNRLKRPSAEFPLGTDQFGRDLYSRVVYGTRISLNVGVSVAVVATTVGLLIGMLCGSYKRVDDVVRSDERREGKEGVGKRRPRG